MELQGEVWDQGKVSDAKRREHEPRPACCLGPKWATAGKGEATLVARGVAFEGLTGVRPVFPNAVR